MGILERIKELSFLDRGVSGPRLSGQGVCGRGGPAEEKALHFIASAMMNEVELLLGFDTFSSDSNAEPVRERDDTLDERRRAAGLGLEFFDEGAVELQDVNGKALEVAQRRVTGAKIVDRDFDSQGAELLHFAGGLTHIANHHAFGQLEFEELRFEAALLEYGGDGAHKIGAVELYGRDIYGHALEWVSGLLPGGSLAAGLLQNLGSDRNNQLVLLGNGNELIRGDGTEFGMGPAQ